MAKFELLPENGWSVERLKEAIRAHVPDGGALTATRGGCVYLTPDGKRCAVGALLSSDTLFRLMSSEVDGDAIGTVLECPEIGATVLGDVPHVVNDTEEFLCALQAVHDGAALRQYARRAGETVPDAIVRWIDDNVVDAA